LAKRNLNFDGKDDDKRQSDANGKGKAMDKEREAGSSLMLASLREASLLLLMPIKEGALLGLRRQMILLVRCSPWGSRIAHL